MAIDRLRRRRKRDEEEPNVTFGESNAWWSEREEIENAPRPKKRGRDAVVEPEPEQVSEFEQNSRIDFEFGPIPEPDPNTRSDETAPDGLAWPFEVLDLTPGCTWQDVSARHKQLAKSHHPDLGGQISPSDAATAADEMRRINRAYSELKRMYRSQSGQGPPADSSSRPDPGPRS
jgi:hypothetical protein